MELNMWCHVFTWWTKETCCAVFWHTESCLCTCWGNQWRSRLGNRSRYTGGNLYTIKHFVPKAQTCSFCNVKTFGEVVRVMCLDMINLVRCGCIREKEQVHRKTPVCIMVVPLEVPRVKKNYHPCKIKYPTNLNGFCFCFVFFQYSVPVSCFVLLFYFRHWYLLYMEPVGFRFHSATERMEMRMFVSPCMCHGDWLGANPGCFGQSDSQRSNTHMDFEPKHK